MRKKEDAAALSKMSQLEKHTERRLLILVLRSSAYYQSTSTFRHRDTSSSGASANLWFGGRVVAAVTPKTGDW